VAAVVAAGDLSSKWLASLLWSERPVHLTDWISMAVVHNQAGAFGLSMGAYTWQLNLALTLAAIVFIIPVTRDLATIDRRAPLALGLILGGACGNLASLVVPPRGVMDFIALNWAAGHSLVLNVADVAAYTGLAMILRTGVRIASALRRETQLATATRVGSAFAQQLSARRTLGRAPASQPALREEIAHDWSIVGDMPLVLADAPPPHESEFPPLDVPALHRSVIIGDAAPPVDVTPLADRAPSDRA
jgi:lipoprotein signal peptidase